MERKKLIEKLKKTIEESELDEIVHDLKAEEASTINNAGIDAQIEYLESVGYDLESLIGD